MEYFSSDGKNIYLEAPQAEFYIPDDYFKDSPGFAENLGDKIKTLGIFDVGICDDKGTVKEMRTFAIPTWIKLNIIDIDSKTVKLPGEDEGVPCQVLIYQKGHAIMPSMTVQDSSNVSAFLDFLLKGKLPKTIPYEKTLAVWQENQNMNKAFLGVPSVIEELIISGIYRYKNDPKQKFAWVIGKDPKISQYDYTTYNIRQITQTLSTFTGMTFEDMDSMITSSLNRTRQNGTELDSPVETLLKL